MSTVLKRRKGIGSDYAAYFARPYAVIRTAVFTIGEIISERIDATRQRRGDIVPRIERNWSYAVMRAWATVIQLDLQVASVVGDILAGRPAIYTTFLAYDEVAHHSGIERQESLSTLRRVDRQIDRIVRAAAAADRPYRFVVLSDHGQSQGTTFLDRYGITLEQMVSDLCHGAEIAPVPGGEDDSLAYIGASAAESDSFAARTLRRAGRSGEAGPEVAPHPSGPELPELSVMASGCLGLITFPREPGRVTLERINQLYPRLIPELARHPGIGFVLVRSERDGAVAVGAHGINYLDHDRIDGDDPLEAFGPNAADHVRRTDRFPNCADIMVNSTYWDDLDEVAAFEELVGSHGGLGGTQSWPFVLHPVDLEWPEDPVTGSENIYRIFRGWQDGFGGSGQEASAASGASGESAASGASAASVGSGASEASAPSGASGSGVDSPGSRTRTSVPGE
jgi:hypothetical protein